MRTFEITLLDGTKNRAVGDRDIWTGQSNVQSVADLGEVSSPVAQPNNPGNPYFGKKPKTPKAFWGHMLAVYIALASGADAGEKQANGMARLGRIITSTVAAPIIKVADGVDFIDPDDRDGDFLKMVGLLSTTKHEDGALLMTPQELAAAMQAWT